ncbi:MAG: phosphatidylserine decarboxylase [Candidatus Wallbacteria bacterium]|nr:phosphatidylserine decarboxylase [Candidatus Wallbacteria bacterium]
MISREALPSVLITIAAAAFFALFPRNRLCRFLLCVSVSILLFLVYFFRDPAREISPDENVLLSPADGRVTGIRECGDHLLVHIFMSPLDVHINRAPCSGTVQRIEYRPGRFLPAYNPQADTENESNELTISRNDGIITVRQISGILARKIVCRVKIGSDLSQGQKIGMIKLGSGCEITFPRHYAVAVREGDHVQAGLTVIAARTDLAPDKNPPVQ